jgi:hypothetical protein
MTVQINSLAVGLSGGSMMAALGPDQHTIGTVHFRSRHIIDRHHDQRGTGDRDSLQSFISWLLLAPPL